MAGKRVPTRVSRGTAALLPPLRERFSTPIKSGGVVPVPAKPGLSVTATRLKSTEPLKVAPTGRRGSSEPVRLTPAVRKGSSEPVKVQAVRSSVSEPVSLSPPPSRTSSSPQGSSLGYERREYDNPPFHDRDGFLTESEVR